MTQIIKIEKTGDIKLDKVSNISELYKKCGFRKNDGFEHIHTWERTVENNIINIELWGRISGKSTIKNSYEFPQPFNKTVYGNCILIGKINMELVDIDKEIWGFSCETQKPTTHVIVSHVNPADTSTNSPTIPIEDNEILPTIDLKSFSAFSVTQNNKIYHDNDTISSLSDNDDYPDSELKEDSYLYSSEEECRVDPQTPHIP